MRSASRQLEFASLSSNGSVDSYAMPLRADPDLRSLDGCLGLARRPDWPFEHQDTSAQRGMSMFGCIQDESGGWQNLAGPDAAHSLHVRWIQAPHDRRLSIEPRHFCLRICTRASRHCTAIALRLHLPANPTSPAGDGHRNRRQPGTGRRQSLASLSSSSHGPNPAYAGSDRRSLLAGKKLRPRRAFTWIIHQPISTRSVSEDWKHGYRADASGWYASA